MAKRGKSKKAFLKRFKISARGKLSRRRVNQDHFNAKQTSGERRAKRKLLPVSKADAKLLRRLLG